MSLIQLRGTIEFHVNVTDFELAQKIHNLLKSNPNGYLKTDVAGSNGHAKRIDKDVGQKTTEKILTLLKEKNGSAAFTTSMAIEYIQEVLQVGSSTTRRALLFGKTDGRLQLDRKGIYHFLELGTTQAPAIESGESKDPIDLPAHT